jgi:hypothetical protein
VFLVIVVTGTGLFTVLRRGSVAGSADLPTASLARAPAASDTAAGQSGGAATEQQGPGVWIPVADTGDDVDEGAADARRETVEKHGQDLIAGRIPTVGRLLLVSSTESAALGAVAPDAAAPPATDAAAAAAAAAGQPTPSAGSGAAGSVPAPALASAVPAAVAALGTPNLLTCYQRLAATSGGRVVAVDRVSYDGHQAVLVILDTPDATSSASSAGAAGDSFQITVIDTRCAASRMADALWYSATAVRA